CATVGMAAAGTIEYFDVW
nr:immunoglobulin heavy chain junction region [Macaca mulatta]MOW47377.1 immunoglobulin heavy chain junction region [Macaca mulatta]MOW48137.1 immunoglobulin heavy chain junction region [Macaca mulatta]MOW48896.1 immunoglobulin heavy chain junction region [Macaca mulatta]MOW50312.1 immunoglobulin heavy chain junction region [Macaca mulatta]